MFEKSDFLVIGSGIAGLIFALEAAEHGSVIILTKEDAKEGSSYLAQGGIASVTSPEDDFEKHIADTLNAGAGICDKKTVELVVKSAPMAIKTLEDYGVSFSKRENGLPDLGKEGGHSKRRILHVDDFTGKAVQETLLARIKEHKNIKVLENMMVVDLITSVKLKITESKCRNYGVYAIDKTNRKVKTFLAKATLLATGGAGKVYLYTSNPDVSTGDGIAMAYRRGCKIANMEFYQFHPTVLYHHKEKSFLISEALRGEGGILINKKGERFLENFHPMKELAPRDIVARGIDRELKRTGDDCVFLDMTHLDADFLISRFPNIHKKLLSLGINFTKEPIPVVPAAHYSCGGIVVDDYARTDLNGLYAAGEVAYTGLHGANRLASNSLLEGIVFAKRAAQDAVRYIKENSVKFPSQIPFWNAGLATDPDESVVVSQNWDEIRRMMWNYVGIVRSNNRLYRAKKRIDLIKQEITEDYWKYYPFQDLIELRNIALVAELIIDSAIYRKESRGLHYNIDYPERDDTLFARPTILWKGRSI